MSLITQLAGARVFDLEQPRFAGMPVHPAHKPGYFYGLHRRHRDSYRPDQHGPRSGASGVLTMMEHSGTHIDALCHQACDMTFYGGVKVDDVERTDGYRQLGAETMRPLLGRGVLLDVAGLKVSRSFRRTHFSSATLFAALQALRQCHAPRCTPEKITATFSPGATAPSRLSCSSPASPAAPV